MVGVYLGLLLLFGLFSKRLLRASSADYFVASRSIGPFLLLMSVFGTDDDRVRAGRVDRQGLRPRHRRLRPDGVQTEFLKSLTKDAGRLVADPGPN